MKNDLCLIEINSECCICLDFLDTEIHKLGCCNNDIHIKCLYEMFVFQPIVNSNVIFTCPLCRKQQPFNCVLSLHDIYKYRDDYNIIHKYILPRTLSDISEIYLQRLYIFVGIIIFFIFIFYIK